MGTHCASTMTLPWSASNKADKARDTLLVSMMATKDTVFCLFCFRKLWKIVSKQNKNVEKIFSSPFCEAGKKYYGTLLPQECGRKGGKGYHLSSLKFEVLTTIYVYLPSCFGRKVYCSCQEWVSVRLSYTLHGSEKH